MEGDERLRPRCTAHGKGGAQDIFCLLDKVRWVRHVKVNLMLRKDLLLLSPCGCVRRERIVGFSSNDTQRHRGEPPYTTVLTLSTNGMG